MKFKLECTPKELERLFDLHNYGRMPEMLADPITEPLKSPLDLRTDTLKPQPYFGTPLEMKNEDGSLDRFQLELSVGITHTDTGKTMQHTVGQIGSETIYLHELGRMLREA